MPKLKSYPIFISHAWDHSSDYDRLEKLLKNAKRFVCRNCSVPRTKRFETKTDVQLEKALRRQIKPAQSVIIIAGMWVKHRNWIKKEIQIAVEMHKNIVVVKPHGAQKMPRELQGFPQQVGWDTQHVISAVRHPVRIDPALLKEIDRDNGPDSGVTANSWKDDVAHNPDFSALQEWLSNPATSAAESFRKVKRKLQRRRGNSG